MMERNEFESRNLRLYFLIAFAFSWLFWIPKALASQGLLAPSILTSFLLSPYNPAAFGPLVAAFSLTYFREGKDGVIRMLKRGFDPRIGKVWYIPIFLLMPAIAGGSLLLSILTEGNVPELLWLSNPLLIVVYFVYIFFLGGPLEEEFGWRGYALDRLQTRFNALVSSVMLGLMWGVWHLPLYFMPGAGPQYQLSMIWALIIVLILQSILFTWLYNNTGGSIFATLIFHTMLNLSTFVIFPIFETELGGLYDLILIIISVIVVLIIWGPKRMARETNK